MTGAGAVPMRVPSHVWGRVLSAHPLIVTATSEGKELPIGAAPLLAAAIGDRPATVLTRLAWEVETPWRLDRLVAAHRRHAAEQPRHRVVMLANSAREAWLLQAAGVRSYLCNHNALVDETAFTVGDPAARTVDAIYNARMKPYKRHALAAAVPSLALIYGRVLPEERAYFQEVCRLMPQALMVNAIEAERTAATLAAPAARRAVAMFTRHIGPAALPRSTVADWLRRARVGLCLSASEGAMIASIEYLLCGLPIVSTRSLGGRDRYFEPDHCVIVPDAPAAIADAVAALAARAIDPHAIRATALAKMRHDRAGFVALVQAIIDEAGGRDEFAARFPALLADDLFPHRPVADFAAEIAGS